MKKLIIFLFFLISFFQLLYSLFKIYQQGLFLPDFALFYQEGLDLRQGINPYTRVTKPCSYPPTALMLFHLLPFLPFAWSQVIWTLLSILALILSAILLSRNFRQALLFLAFSFLAFPVKYNLGMGQINLLLLLFITLNFYFWQKRKDFLSGLFLSLSLMLKLTPVLLVLFFLLRKKFRLVLSSFLFSFFGLGLSFLLLGKELFSSYFLKALPDYLNIIENNFYYNQSLLGSLGRLFESSRITLVVFLFLSGVFLFLSFWKSSKDNKVAWSSVLTANILLSGFSWQHHLVILLPAMVITAQKLVKKRRKWPWWSFLGIIYFLIAYNIKNPFPLMGSLWGNFLLSHGTWGMILLWRLLFSLSNQRCQE